MTDDPARNRFLAISLIRLGGVALAFLGIAIIFRRLVEPADIIGTALLAIGAFDVLVLPVLLARRWRSK